MPAVLTGDIISSSKLPAAQRQQQLNLVLQGLFSTLRSVWRRKEQLRAESVQGDAFQVYLLEQQEALRVGLLIKCFCLAQHKVSDYRFDCRLSIGIGSVRLLHPQTLAQSGGTAFDYSGRGLKAISRTGSQMCFYAQKAVWNQPMNMGLALADELMSHWTPAQSQAVLLKLQYPTQTQDWLAGRVGIGRSAYSQRLNQAGWSAIEKMLEYAAALIK